MRQQVNATLRITFDADATLSRDQLASAIEADLMLRLTNRPTVLPVEAVAVSVTSVQEEADIYGLNEPEDDRCG